MRIMNTFSVDILNETDVSCCKLGKDFSFKGVWWYEYFAQLLYSIYSKQRIRLDGLQIDTNKKKSGCTNTVNHDKLDRQNGNIPLMMTGKMCFWLLQIQALPPCRSPQSWPHPSLMTGEQKLGPPGVSLPLWACALPLSSPGYKPEQTGPLSGAPTKNRDSTLPLA